MNPLAPGAETISLTREQLAAFADEVAEKTATRLAPLLKSAKVETALKRRLTVEEFAACIQRGAEHVRRKIRSREISADLFDGPPYMIHPKALELFGVTPELAAERLEEWQQAQQAEAPAQTPAQDAHRSAA